MNLHMRMYVYMPVYVRVVCVLGVFIGNNQKRSVVRIKL